MKRRLLLFATAFLLTLIVGGGLIAFLEARSSYLTLQKIQQVRPHATAEEVQQRLGPPEFTFAAHALPGWATKSALGSVTEGTVYVYLASHYAPRLIYIHLHPDKGVQFVTWTRLEDARDFPGNQKP